MKKKFSLIKEKFELAFIAVTYAEAGEWKIAEDYLEKIESLNQSRNHKMILVSLDSGFTDETVEYTVNLAERMQYDLLAVNAYRSQKPGFKFDVWGNGEFRERIRQVFNSLVKKAQMNRIRCETLITTRDIRSQIRKLIRQIRQVELVLVQADRDQELFLDLDVPVYQITPVGNG